VQTRADDFPLEADAILAKVRFPFEEHDADLGIVPGE
jgi:hypothetical protein